MTDTPMTVHAAEVRLRQYGERTSTWSTATHNDGTEKALYEIALTLADAVKELRALHNVMADRIESCGLDLYDEERETARLRLAWQSARRGRKHLRDAVSAGPALPWAAVMADEDLELFLNDLVSAAINRWQSDPEVPHRETLRLIEEACARWRTPGGWRSDTPEIPAVFPEKVDLQPRLDSVLALCDDAEKQATRWEHPLPVPEWVGQVRKAAEGSTS